VTPTRDQARLCPDCSSGRLYLSPLGGLSCDRCLYEGSGGEGDGLHAARAPAGIEVPDAPAEVGPRGGDADLDPENRVG
jgi:hypothetical protein